MRRWLAEGDWRPCASPSKSKKLDGLADWLNERFRRHAGNADVVRQELACEKGIVTSLRTVERAVAPLRRELVAAARATVRFETRPGEQLQIDFGERRVEIGGAAVKVFFFVATLGYSRKLHVRAYGHEKQDSWFDGMESAFRSFGGVPQEVLLDNARALILDHDPASREVVLHPRLHAFARHWGFRIAPAHPIGPAPRMRLNSNFLRDPMLFSECPWVIAPRRAGHEVKTGRAALIVAPHLRRPWAPSVLAGPALDLPAISNFRSLVSLALFKPCSR